MFVCCVFKHADDPLFFCVSPSGVKSFLGNVLADDAAVGIITETNSTPDTHVVDAVLELLGADIAPHVRVFPTHSTQLSSSSDEEVDDWGDVDEVGVVGGTTLEQAVQQAQAKVCVCVRVGGCVDAGGGKQAHPQQQPIPCVYGIVRQGLLRYLILDKHVHLSPPTGKGT